ncbi:STAS-like domain-containing protein [Candidatus Peregrinibacteria bacterium]|nr:STAS-like domain-containing protein [Candidatus Peregrinibacteria bacterium]
MIKIKLFKQVGPFAENKDVAKDIRLKKLIPALSKGQNVILDFENVEGATQSFIHALISDLIRKFGNEVLDKIKFKSCNDTVKAIISIVTDYMQESA